MILPENAFVRFAASLRIFGTLVAGAVLIAGMNTALTGPRTAAGCENHDAPDRSPMNARP
jgi:sugar phosphate permease